jgi:hydrogenase-4 component E
MSDSAFEQLIALAAGLALAAAVVVLWRRSLRAVVRALALQGVAIAMLAFVQGIHGDDHELLVAATIVLGVKAVGIPLVLRRVIRASGDHRESEPLVNVATSLLTGAVLTLVAYATTRDLVHLDPSPATNAIPLGMAIVLIGFFTLVSRRKAVSQVVGFLLVDNGIALVALLATDGVPLVVELGATLDLLFVVLVVEVLVAHIRMEFGTTDLDQLQELHD